MRIPAADRRRPVSARAWFKLVLALRSSRTDVTAGTEAACLHWHVYVELSPVRKLWMWHVYRGHVHSGMLKLNFVLSGSAAIGMFTADIVLAGRCHTGRFK